MKKSIYIKFAVLFLVLSFVLPKISSAQTTSDLQAQIAALLAEVQSLQTQLANMQGMSAQWCHSFNTNLSIGQSGSEVTALQTALQKDGESITVSNSFDDQTASAVTGFQEKYTSDILTPNGLQYGTGYAGNATRAKLNSLFGCGTTQTTITTPVPTINIGPTSSTIIITTPIITTPIITKPILPVTNITAVLTSSDNGRTITLTSGQNIQVTLSNPGDGGYVFENPQYDASILQLNSHVRNNPSGNVMPGNFGTDVWQFSALQSGTTDLVITATRPWSGGGTETIFKVSIVVGNTMTITQPAITGVSGPQQLIVGKMGTWSVSAYDPNGGSLSYSVNWGETPIMCSSGYGCATVQSIPIQQNATFTHSYSQVGIYTPTFTVTNTAGKTAQTSLTVNVSAISAQPTISYIIQPVEDINVIQPGVQTRVIGSGFSLNSPVSVSIGNYSVSGQTSSDGTQVTFIVPNIPAGNYSLYVNDHVFQTNSVNVTVPSTNQPVPVVVNGCPSTPVDVVENALGNPNGTGPFEKLDLATSSHPEILQYRILWFTGGWSGWYVPGVSDVDTKLNLDGTSRRIWSYFDDHTHEYMKCPSFISLPTTTSTLAQPTITAAENNALSSPVSVVNGAVNMKIGSYILSAGSAEAIRLTNVAISIGSGVNLQNLVISSGGIQIGQTIGVTSGGATYNFPASLTAPAGNSVVIDVYADIAQATSTGTMSPATTLVGCTAVGANTNISTHCNSVQGQSLTAN